MVSTDFFYHGDMENYAASPAIPRAVSRSGRPRWIWLVIAVVTVALMAGSAYAFTGSSYGNSPRVVSVVGVGTKTVKPASATVSFSVVFEGSSRQEAIAQGESIFSSTLSGLSQFGDLRIDKNAFQVSENADSAGGGIVYRYVNAAKITTNDPIKVQDISKYLYQSGATAVTQVRYIPEDQEKVDRDLRTAAVKDARAKAQQMAAASGARLGRAISIQEGASTGQTGTPVTAGATGDSGSLSEVGEIELQAVTTVIFQLR